MHSIENSANFAANHQIAREIEAECAVLLRNEGGILPLPKSVKGEAASNHRIAFIGAFAKEPRFRGGGSSKVHPWKVPGSLEATEGYADITYCEGYRLGGDVVDEALEAEAVRAAAQAQTAVIFAGLPAEFESEGFDRSHMRMPESQNHLIRAVCAAQPRTVVVLMNGSAVELPWAEEPAFRLRIERIQQRKL